MMLAARYREVRMPNLSLTPEEVDKIVRYVEGARGTAALEHGAHLAPARPAAAHVNNPVLDAAFALQRALARDTMAGLSAQAIALRNAAMDARMPSVAEAAADLSRQTTLADARRAFGLMSDALIRCLEDVGTPLPVGVRIAYCPMARKSWVQSDGPLANPYYGGKMLECGAFTN